MGRGKSVEDKVRDFFQSEFHLQPTVSPKDLADLLRERKYPPSSKDPKEQVDELRKMVYTTETRVMGKASVNVYLRWEIYETVPTVPNHTFKMLRSSAVAYAQAISNLARVTPTNKRSYLNKTIVLLQAVVSEKVSRETEIRIQEELYHAYTMRGLTRHPTLVTGTSQLKNDDISRSIDDLEKAKTYLVKSLEQESKVDERDYLRLAHLNILLAHAYSYRNRTERANDHIQRFVTFWNDAIDMYHIKYGEQEKPAVVPEVEEIVNLASECITAASAFQNDVYLSSQMRKGCAIRLKKLKRLTPQRQEVNLRELLSSFEQGPLRDDPKYQERLAYLRELIKANQIPQS